MFNSTVKYATFARVRHPLQSSFQAPRPPAPPPSYYIIIYPKIHPSSTTISPCPFFITKSNSTRPTHYDPPSHVIFPNLRSDMQILPPVILTPHPLVGYLPHRPYTQKILDLSFKYNFFFFFYNKNKRGGEEGTKCLPSTNDSSFFSTRGYFWSKYPETRNLYLIWVPTHGKMVKFGPPDWPSSKMAISRLG